MLRSQIQSATALAEGGKGKSASIDGFLARKRLSEGYFSPPRPQKKTALHHPSQGRLSGFDGLKSFASTSATQSPSSGCPGTAVHAAPVHGAILSPPCQPCDIPPTSHESNCFAQTSVPISDTVNAAAALGTPPSEETALQECYHPIIQYGTGSFPLLIDGSLPPDASTFAPPLWPTIIDQLGYASWDDSRSQRPNVDTWASLTADMIALGHSSSLSTTWPDPPPEPALPSYQNFPGTPLSEQHFPLGAAQPAVGYDAVGQNGFGATPDATATGFNFGLPPYQSPVFRDEAAVSLAQTYQGLMFNTELPFPLTHGGYRPAPTKQLSPGSASSDEEAVVWKTSQSPESKTFLDDVPFKTEQRSPSQEIKEQSSLSPEPVASIQGQSPQNHPKAKTKLDPAVELQLVHQCFNSNGRSFALIPEPNDNWAAQANSGNSTQGQKPRKPLGEDARQETSRTRDVGACVRCKIQRVRCKPNLDEPDGPCLACIKVAQNRSQKRIHNIGCHRYKLQEISLFRTSRLRFTKRWQGAQIRDVPTFGKPVKIWIYQGLAKAWPITVRRYEFDNMDPQNIVARHWKDPKGGYWGQSDYPYALASVNETKEWYRGYITAEKFEAYGKVLDDKEAKSHREQVCEDIVKDVYRLAHKNHYERLPKGTKWDFYRPPDKLDVKQISEENFMAGIFEMWFAMRQSTGSSWVVRGEAELDPADGDFKPPSSWNAVTTLATPKMVVGQFNSINITCVLRPLAKVLIKVLMSWITDRHYHRWMSIFYATFIVLREIAHTTLDAYQHGARNPDYDVNGPLKPNWPENIVELHESANIILAHWHYFNCSTDPTNVTDKVRAKSPLKELSDEQLQTVQDIWPRVVSWKTPTPEEGPTLPKGSYECNWPGWCEPLYFAGQMFDVHWRPLPVFRG